MKKWVRWTLNTILILALLVGAVQFIRSEWESRLNRQNNDAAMELAKGETTPPESSPDPTGNTDATEPAAPEETVPEETVPIPDDPCIQELLTLNLEALQEERAGQGRLYKDQQFGTKADRAAAEQTRSRMQARIGACPVEGWRGIATIAAIERGG